MSFEYLEDLTNRRTSATVGQSRSIVPYRVVSDTASPTEEALEADIVAHFSGLVYNNRMFTEYTIDTQEDDRTWRISVTYEGRGGWYPDVDSATDVVLGMQFDTGSGGTQHVETPIKTLARFPNSASVAGGNIIGLDGDHVVGVDVPDPVFAFSVFRKLDPTVVTRAYVQLLKFATGKINEDVFLGSDPHSLMFLGAKGSRRGAEAWGIDYYFQERENRLRSTDNPVYVPGFVDDEGHPIPCDKHGWSVLDVRWVTSVDDAAHRLIRKPYAVYEQQIFDETAFASLLL